MVILVLYNTPILHQTGQILLKFCHIQVDQSNNSGFLQRKHCYDCWSVGRPISHWLSRPQATKILLSWENWSLQISHEKNWGLITASWEKIVNISLCEQQTPQSSIFCNKNFMVQLFVKWDTITGQDTTVFIYTYTCKLAKSAHPT